MLITISGPPGSGTTTVSRLVAGALGLELVPGGEVFRAMASERAMSLAAFGSYAAKHPEVDVELDARLAARARQGGAVIESRLAGWVVHNEGVASLTVWLDCDRRIRAERVAGREGVGVAQALADNDAREELERQRWRALYGVDVTDMSIYDLVLDSGKQSEEELTAAIVDVAPRHAE